MPYPPPMTVLDAPYQEERQITALDGVAAATPEISYTRALNSIDTLSLYIRGAGPTAPGQITLDGAVGIYQDGFAVSRLQANTFDLLEPERIEVLAGPQGAAYGRDTTGGAINIISRAPAGKLNFDQTVDFGNRDSYRILSSLDTPRWHGLSAKITLLASAIDGYVKNQTANSHDYGSATQRAARLQLQSEPLSNFTAQYFVERGALDSTPEYDSNPTQNGQSLYSSYTYYADPNGPMRSTYRPINLPLSTSNHTAQGLTVTWHVAPGFSVESRTGYRTQNANEQQDYAEIEGQPTGSIDLYNLRQFSQDLRTSGAVFAGQLRYTAGASYFKETGQHDNDYLLLPYFPGLSLRGDQLEQISAATRSLAYYVQLAWRPAFLGRHIELATAGRYTRDVKDATRSIIVDGADETETGVRNHLSYGRATPEASLTYDMTDGFSAYAKVSTSYEAGGALENAPGGAFATATFRPETSTTYEVGLRSKALGERLSVKGAVFDSRRKDVQYALPVNLITADVLDFQRVTVWGAGFDVSVRPLRELSLTASGTYLHWKIDQVEDLSGTAFDRNVFALPYTPRYSAAAAADYTFARLDRRELVAHVDYVYRARMFADAGAGPAVPGNQFDTQPAYGLLNGRVTVSQETDWAHRVKFSVWGRNILNRKYYQPAIGGGAGVANLGGDSTAAPAGYDARIGAWAEPRTYGIAVRYEY